MWWKIFDVLPGWVYAALLAVSLIVSGVMCVSMNKAKLDLANYRAEVAEATRKAEAAARKKEKEMQDNADRIARKGKQREAELAAAVARSNDALGLLHNEIDRLNARRPPENTSIASCTGEASTARKLLGSCAERYRGVAEEADGLRLQVTGLQEFVASLKGN